MKKALRRFEMLLHSALMAGLLTIGTNMMLTSMYFPGSILLSLSLGAIIISLFWKRLAMVPRQARLACYYIEAPAFLICWLYFKLEHMPLTAQVYLMSAVIFPCFGYISSIKTYKIRKRSA